MAYDSCSAIIVIASAGQEKERIIPTRYGDMRSRSCALLKYTKNDAEGIFERWKKADAAPDCFHRLLVDPTVAQVEQTILDLSRKLSSSRAVENRLDLYFAGHGEKSGNLVFKDGTFSPLRLLELQCGDVTPKEPRSIGVFLDSCHSGAFLIKLALEIYPRCTFRIEDGLASCLPDEESFEFPLLEHGVFTYTRLNLGNRSVDLHQFGKAILEQDLPVIAKGLQGLVANMGNATAFLTEGKQFSVDLMKEVIKVPYYAEETIGPESNFDSLCSKLTKFKITANSTA